MPFSYKIQCSGLKTKSISQCEFPIPISLQMKSDTPQPLLHSFAGRSRGKQATLCIQSNLGKMPTCHGQTRLLLHGSGFQTVPLQCSESKGPLRLSTAQCSHCSKGKCSSSSNSQMQHLEVPKSHEFCLLHLQRGRSRSQFQGVVMAAEGT